MIEVIKDAIRLDPLELYPNASHEPLRNNSELIFDRQPERKRRFFPVTFRFAEFVKRYLKYSLDFRPLANFSMGSHCFFGFTNNQRSALVPIVAALCLSSHGELAELNDTKRSCFSRRRMYWWSLLFLPALIWRMRLETGYKRQSFRWYFDDYLLIYGTYIETRKRLRKWKPRSVVVSNDHSRLPCTIVRAAQDEGIPTFYVQHACVTDRFPPLRMDFALLDGQDAKEKYLAAADQYLPTHSRRALIELIGITKLDGYQHLINENKTVQTIGVCFSLADDANRILELLDGFADLKAIQIRVRPHMGMPLTTRDQIHERCKRHGFDISIHNDESALNYLKAIDLLVCGVSSIALEASLMNITVVNYAMNQEHPDWYGFIKNDLLPSVQTIDELKEFVQAHRGHRIGNRKATKRYCATVGTEHEGKSAPLAAQIILKRASSFEAQLSQGEE